MKIIIALIVVITLLCILFYGSKHEVALQWMPGTSEHPETYQDVKTDTDIHDALNFVK